MTLIEAVREGDADRVRALIHEGASLDAVDRYGRTALHHAVIDGRGDLVALLLGAGADVEAKDHPRGETPLMLACGPVPALGGDLGLVRQLIEGGADVNAVDRRGARPVYSLVRWNSESALRLLGEAGGELEPPGPDASPLTVALREGYVESAKYLLAQGCTPGPLALLDALTPREASASIVRLLLSSGVDVNVAGASDVRPLHVAAERGLTEVVDLLLQAGADITAEDLHGARAVHRAAMRGHTSLVVRFEDEWRRAFPERPLAELVSVTAIDRASGIDGAKRGKFLALDGHRGSLFYLLGLRDDEAGALRVLSDSFGMQRPPVGPLVIVKVEGVGRPDSVPNLRLVDSHARRLRGGDPVWFEQASSWGPGIGHYWERFPTEPVGATARLAVIDAEPAPSSEGGRWFRAELVRVLSYADGLCIAWEELRTGATNEVAGSDQLWPP